MVEEQGEEENILKKCEKELINTALAILVSLAVSHDEDYANNNENEPKNKNKSIDHNIDRPLAATE
jgi:hypothetical protein